MLGPLVQASDRVSCFFFFSSRRRHTRCSRDWSSDVCSSDLADLDGHPAVALSLHGHHGAPAPAREPVPLDPTQPVVEERRRVEPLAEQPFQILARHLLGHAAERVLVDVLQLPASEVLAQDAPHRDRKSTRLNSSHGYISYAVFCLKKKKTKQPPLTRNRNSIRPG